MPELFVVMPVYNEQHSLESVVREWIEEFRQHTGNFVLFAIDDGSTDQSLEILHKLRSIYPELRVESQPNCGHGPACLVGYKVAIRENADWLFQIDSDGQSLPDYFRDIWNLREKADAIFGYRKTRDDGLARALISRCLSVMVALTVATWVKGTNVPYRLMKLKNVSPIISSLPEKVTLVNVFLAIALQNRLGLTWVDIRFGKRRGGEQSLGYLVMGQVLVELVTQLLRNRRWLTQRSTDPEPESTL